MSSGASEQGMLPEHKHNDALLAAVHPPGWTNPTPSGRYNLVVIGAGTAGLVSAAATAGLGGKVALIEEHLMGGDCLNVGCVPSKAVLASAHQARAKEAESDFAAVMERMRRLRAEIAPVDGADRFTELGVDVFLGRGRFSGPKSIEVGGQTLEFARAVIATGGKAFVPPIPGLEEAGYLTNDTFFQLTERPKRLTVIGGGPIGCELAQAMARLGAQVTIVDAGARILSKDDEDASRVVHASLLRDGINILSGASVESVEPNRTVVVRSGGETIRVEGDAILVATGRKANTGDLGLEHVGVRTTERGLIAVDDKLRTANKQVFAAGDCCSAYQFTHAADAMARIVIRNALFFGRERVSKLVVPWATYTQPEVAHVGLTPDEAAKRGVAITSFEQKFDHVDRAIVEEKTEGFVKVHVKKGSDEIVGATVVADHAGELISELCMAMTKGIGLGGIASVIHPYPTTALAIKQVADQYGRTRLTPFVARLFAWILKWRRR